jgi:hypothetical protein
MKSFALLDSFKKSFIFKTLGVESKIFIIWASGPFLRKKTNDDPY